jgi:hypothetical protein
MEGRTWTVLWDSIQQCSDHSFNSLKFEKQGALNSLDGMNVESILQTRYVRDQQGIDCYLAEWQPLATPLPDRVNPLQAPPLQAPTQSTAVLPSDMPATSDNAAAPPMPQPTTEDAIVLAPGVSPLLVRLPTRKRQHLSHLISPRMY